MKKQPLVDYRQSQNLSIPEMAKKIGVSKSFYEKIEYEDRLPSYNFLVKFKNAFPTADTDKIFLP